MEVHSVSITGRRSKMLHLAILPFGTPKFVTVCGQRFDTDRLIDHGEPDWMEDRGRTCWNCTASTVGQKSRLSCMPTAVAAGLEELFKESFGNGFEIKRYHEAVTIHQRTSPDVAISSTVTVHCTKQQIECLALFQAHIRYDGAPLRSYQADKSAIIRYEHPMAIEQVTYLTRLWFGLCGKKPSDCPKWMSNQLKDC